MSLHQSLVYKHHKILAICYNYEEIYMLLLDFDKAFCFAVSLA